MKCAYATKDGRIVSPGKFEGEPYWVPEAWDIILNGGQNFEFDDCGTLISSLNIDFEFIKDFPALSDSLNRGEHLFMWETEQGFIHHYIGAHWAD